VRERFQAVPRRLGLERPLQIVGLKSPPSAVGIAIERHLALSLRSSVPEALFKSHAPLWKGY